MDKWYVRDTRESRGFEEGKVKGQVFLDGPFSCSLFYLKRKVVTVFLECKVKYTTFFYRNFVANLYFFQEDEGKKGDKGRAKAWRGKRILHFIVDDIPIIFNAFISIFCI